MANHGILHHSGKGISFRQMNQAVQTTYNFAPSFCFYVPRVAAQMLGRSYYTGTFDLSDISVHNCIEHDASLTRKDTFHHPDQSKPDVALVEELLASGTGPAGNITAADLSRMLGKRRTESCKTNGQFTTSSFHDVFGSANAATLLKIFGGKVDELRTFLLEERIPEGWQPKERHQFGLTINTFQLTASGIELKIQG